MQTRIYLYLLGPWSADKRLGVVTMHEPESLAGGERQVGKLAAVWLRVGARTRCEMLCG